MKLWVDVEDIFRYVLHENRPSGIQRVAFELQRALLEIAPDSVQFIRHGKQYNSFIPVPFAQLEALFDDLSATQLASAAVVDHQASPAESSAAQDVADNESSYYRRLRRRVLTILPQPLRAPAVNLWAKTAETAVAAAAFLKVVFCLKTWHAPKSGNARGTEQEKTLAPEHGDWLVALGATWSNHEYAARISSFCALHELRFALLVYDIIPIRRPEWVDAPFQKSFRDWFSTVVPLANVVLTISRATAEDVERYEKEVAFGLQGRVRPIPLGTGFKCPAVPVRTRRLPAYRSFALIVSTIEPRKNHLLLFRIWRELTEIMPSEKIPALVFAGRVGWLVQDLMQQLKNTDFLNGKIVLIDSPSDGELATLYEDCLFTLYPSFYEGWGLPVSESLSYGAPCVSSDRTSLPEAGGNLARYFDPDNLADAVRAVREVIDDPDALEAWRARVKREFKPVTWTHAARAIIDQLKMADGTKLQAPRTATIAAAD